jgi:mRNA interferase RelE/StbE
MDKFRSELAPAASKDLDTLDIGTSEKVLSDLRLLEDYPFPRGKLIKKIKGKKSAFYRLRTDKFRVFYEIQQMKVVILRVVSKKEADRFIRKL